MKAVYETFAIEAWGHSVTKLLEALPQDLATPPETVLVAARELDKMYIATRYPNGLAAGAPTQFYTRGEAERSIAHAKEVHAFCRPFLRP